MATITLKGDVSSLMAYDIQTASDNFANKLMAWALSFNSALGSATPSFSLEAISYGDLDIYGTGFGIATNGKLTSLAYASVDTSWTAKLSASWAYNNTFSVKGYINHIQGNFSGTKLSLDGKIDFQDPLNAVLNYGEIQSSGVTFSQKSSSNLLSGTPIQSTRALQDTSGNAISIDALWDSDSIAVTNFGLLVQDSSFLAGNDVLDVGDVEGEWHGFAGNDSLKGGALANHLFGDAGNDTLDGGKGVDTLEGGAGDDTYYLDDSAELDHVVELADAGSDTLVLGYSVSVTTALSLSGGLANFENLKATGTGLFNLTGNDAANALTGNAKANLLTGGAGNDTLDGGAGIDTLIGGTGDDTYRVDSASELGLIIEDADSGVDTLELGYNVKAATTVSLSGTLANIESLTAKGTGIYNLTGNDGANLLTGNAQANRLTGGAGSDTLDGGAGNDTLLGGTGDDTYRVDSAKDVITEADGAGTDAVEASVSWTLGTTLEHLSLTGSANLNGKGNTLNNVVTGNTGNNLLQGDAGNDSLSGGAGDDTLEGGTGLDTLAGGAGNDLYKVDGADELALIDEASDSGSDTLELGYDVAEGATVTLDGSLANIEHLKASGNGLFTLVGNDANNALTGNAETNELSGGAGNDTLDGGAGNDTLSGGAGDDTYVVDSLDDVLQGETSGNDTIIASISYTLASDFENLTLSSSTNLNGTGNDVANVLTGNAGNNSLDGGMGADTLVGGAGIDTLVGGTGNDTYVVDNAKDVISETSDADADSVEASVSWTLGANLENLTLTGSGKLNGKGNALDNLITGNSSNNLLQGDVGNDTLIGGAGSDTMSGGAGDDHYVVDNAKDSITDGADAGTDSVEASVSWTLGANLENLSLTDSAAINGKGNTLANTLSGNSGNNLLQGDAGNDSLSGGAGDDTLEGGTGLDTLTGGVGNDLYRINLADEKALINEGADAGTDTLELGYDVTESTTVTLDGSLANIEHLTATGTGLFNLTGNAADNALTGNSQINRLSGGAGNDTLDGGQGIDTLAGGAGDDRYKVDSADELNLIEEAADSGSDILELGYNASNTLATTVALSDTLANIEHLTAKGSGLFNLTGNNSDNALTGNAQANLLSGGAGNDILSGDAGNDTLIGGTGNDSMMGGAGSDIYEVDSASDKAVETDAVVKTGGIDLVKASVSFTLGNNVEKLTLTGSANSNGTGNDLANTLTGNIGDNVLDGGEGADTLAGGAGNDTYVVDSTKDVINEAADAGSDSVQASVSWTLGATLENLSLTGSANLNGKGSSLANTLTGNSGNNQLQGDAGNDSLIGGAGDDTLEGGSGSDTLAGGAGNDLYKVDNADELAWIDEGVGSGSDTLELGYNVSTTEVTSVELSGSLANIEHLSAKGTTGLFNLTGNGSANLLTGNDQANLLTGDAGNDTLDGGAGIDSLIGGTGHDTYRVDNAGELALIVEDADSGLDTLELGYTVKAATLVSLSGTLANIEHLTAKGTGLFNLTGNDSDNTLTGNAQANTLDGGSGDDSLVGGAGNDSLLGGAGGDVLRGGTGKDTLRGGAGNDAYIVDDLGDVVSEDAPDGGEDQVYSSVNFTLGDNVENLYLENSSKSLTGKGNALNNYLSALDMSVGCALSGAGGNDTIASGAGNDTLSGGEGDDLFGFLRGQIGSDVVTGDAGTDEIAFYGGGSDIATSQLWFRHVGNNLEVSIIGTSEKVTVKDWYSATGSNNHVEKFSVNGSVLLDANVENLVTAMGAFSPPAAGQTSLTQAQHDALDAIIAANWQAPG